MNATPVPQSIPPDDLDKDSDIVAAAMRVHERAAPIPTLDWLTGSARDAVRIAVCFAGFDCKELVGRLARIKSRGALLNVVTVYRVLAEQSRAWDARNAETGADHVTRGG